MWVLENLACRRAEAGADFRPVALRSIVNPAEPPFYGKARGQINGSASQVAGARPIPAGGAS
jgi:hypothetical protein